MKLQWSDRQPGGIYTASVPEISSWFQIIEPTHEGEPWKAIEPNGLVLGCESLEEAKRQAEKRLCYLLG